MKKAFGHLCLYALLLAAGPASALDAAIHYREQVFDAAGQQVKVRIPSGYELELLSDQLQGPRLLTFAENGDLFIGSKSGEVYRLTPPYRDPNNLVELDGYPHSVAFRPGEILVARSDGVYRAAYRTGQAQLEAGDFKKLAPLPVGGGHSSRTVAVGPDGRIYASLGIRGNCSDEYLDESYPFNRRRGGILVLQEGKGQASWKTFASGLRNPVGVAWHPQTGVMYASNNGPDHQGFEQPPEYFSRIDEGSFHGMPWFQFDGKKVRRDSCAEGSPPHPVSRVSVPVATFPARNAPMGVAFVPPGAMHKDLEMAAIVALRGSWGTRPKGRYLGDPATRRPPKIVAVRFEKDAAARVQELVTGFQLPDGERWARPVGVAIGPDGALYFTSDSGINGLFRLRRQD